MDLSSAQSSYLSGAVDSTGYFALTYLFTSRIHILLTMACFLTYVDIFNIIRKLKVCIMTILKFIIITKVGAYIPAWSVYYVQASTYNDNIPHNSFGQYFPC